jgi:hypothetical protein
MMSKGTERKAPVSPHIHDQNTIPTKTRNEFISRRRLITVGVANCVSRNTISR